MSAYHGRQGKGAAKIRREVKREEAEARNELTLPERRSTKVPGKVLLRNIFERTA